MNLTVVFKEAIWLPRSTRQFKGQARSFDITDSAASQACVVGLRFALAIRAQAWFPRENKDEHIFEILR